MANVTFLIGNGFDLACGLRSRYSDTYDGYIRSKSSSPEIRDFKGTIQKDIVTWADFEMRMAEYAKSFETERAFVECVRDYTTFLHDYLLAEQTTFWEKYSQIDLEIRNAIKREMARSIARFYSGLTNNDSGVIENILRKHPNNHYSFINFNYTDIFDVLLSKIIGSDELSNYLQHKYSSDGVLHIHGSLSHDIILGVDNKKQFGELKFPLSARGMRNFIKPMLNVQYDANRLITAVERIKNSAIICTFGASLGDSDYTWRNLIAEWLLSDSDHHLVIYNYGLAAKKYHSAIVTLRMDDEEDEKERLLNIYFGKIEAERKEKLARQIHIPTGRNIFRIYDEWHKAVLKEEARQEKFIESFGPEAEPRDMNLSSHKKK